MGTRKLIKSHIVAIFLAVVVGVISIAPQIYFSQDKNYKGIQMFGTDAEYDYVAKMNQSQYDDYSKGPFPPDPGKNYYLAPEFNVRMMGFIGRVFNVRVIEVNTTFKFIVPVLIFLVLYGWLLEMFSSRAIALIAPLFVMFGINLLDPGEILRLTRLKTDIDTFLPYTRPSSPQISSLFLFVGLWSIYRIINRIPRFRTILLAGLLVGFSIYVYVFSWTMLTALSGLCLIYFFLKKENSKVKKFLLLLLVNGIVSLPFFLNMLKARLDVDYIDTTARIGLIHTHLPTLGIWIVLGYLALIFLWPRKHESSKYFLLFCFTALLVVLNQQVIIGTRLQPGHYHWYITKPLIAIILTPLVVYWGERIVSNKKCRMAMCVSLGSIFFLNAIVIQTHSYIANYPQFKENQRYAPLFVFLSDHYPTRQIIWTNHGLSTLILAYTRHGAPDNIYATQYTDSQNHLRNMLFLEYRLKGISEKNIANTMRQDRDYVTSRIFGLYYRDLPGNHQLPDTELDKLTAGYKEFYKIPLGQVFKNLKIDLAIEDKSNNNFDFDGMKYVSRVDMGDGVYIYELNK